jgi:hypothetical protein
MLDMFSQVLTVSAASIILGVRAGSNIRQRSSLCIRSQRSPHTATRGHRRFGRLLAQVWEGKNMSLRIQALVVGACKLSE